MSLVLILSGSVHDRFTESSVVLITLIVGADINVVIVAAGVEYAPVLASIFSVAIWK